MMIYSPMIGCAESSELSFDWETVPLFGLFPECCSFDFELQAAQ